MVYSLIIRIYKKLTVVLIASKATYITVGKTKLLFWSGNKMPSFGREYCWKNRWHQIPRRIEILNFFRYTYTTLSVLRCFVHSLDMNLQYLENLWNCNAYLFANFFVKSQSLFTTLSSFLWVYQLLCTLAKSINCNSLRQSAWKCIYSYIFNLS